MGRTPHYYAECGDKGKCDRKTGQCECYVGYTGKGCKRSSCPTSNGLTCSGHGVCKTLAAVNSGYTEWDAEKTQVCVCDAGYEGYGCVSVLAVLEMTLLAFSIPQKILPH